VASNVDAWFNIHTYFITPSPRGIFRGNFLFGSAFGSVLMVMVLCLPAPQAAVAPP